MSFLVGFGRTHTVKRVLVRCCKGTVGDDVARRKILKEEDYDRMLRSGRGQGRGSNYKPFIQVHDFGSQGRSSKMPGVLVSRDHHFLSDGESRFHPFLEFDDTVVDIREQFPVLPRQLCIDVARLLGIRYPNIPRTKVSLVLTLDSLAERIVEDRSEFTAYSVKRSADLRNKRTLGKLEIERACCEILGIRWFLVTEKNVDPIVADNLAWASRPLRGLFKEEFSAWRSTDALLNLLEEIQLGTFSLPILVQHISAAAEVDPDYALNLLRCLIWEKILRIDLAVPIVRSKEITIQSVSTQLVERASNDVAR